MRSPSRHARLLAIALLALPVATACADDYPDPETVTVEQVQALPRAIEVADRCRHLTDGE